MYRSRSVDELTDLIVTKTNFLWYRFGLLIYYHSFLCLEKRKKKEKEGRNGNLKYQFKSNLIFFHVNSATFISIHVTIKIH